MDGRLNLKIAINAAIKYILALTNLKSMRDFQSEAVLWIVYTAANL